ncbi:MAG: hypothetical protein KF691_01180 [Phycisphaeraceae bacterium]|nr:hypothetical protein [Phycisphaeraceae bacterium]
MKTMRSGLARCAVVCGAVLWSATALGQVLQTLPPASNDTAGTGANSIPLANYTAGTYQVMYGADLLTGIPSGSVITGMQMRLEKSASSTFPTSGFTVTRYDVTMATSSLTPLTMSTNFATNMVNPVAVRSGSLGVAAGAYQWLNNGAGVPEPWGPVISFTTGYVYNGGPLVILLRVVSPSSTFAAYADSTSSGSSQHEVHNTGDANATTANFQTAGGLIVRLTFTPPAVDLAKGVTKVIVADRFAGAPGPSGDGVLMWTSEFTQQAVAAANQFDTIGPGSDFVGLAWRLSASNGAPWPGAVASYSQFVVQLSRSNNAPGALSQTVANNVGADAVTVRSGALGFPMGSFQPKGSAATAPFGPELAFSNAYHYRGGPLLSVVRHTGQNSGSAGFMDALGIGQSGYNVDVQGWQTNSSIAAVTSGSSSYLTTMYSVDAGTSSPLNQLSPGADAFGITLSPVLQTILSASELKYIPPGSVIDSLWLRQIASEGAGPSSDVTAASFELTVSTAKAPPSGMSTSFATNEGADKVVVYSGGLFVPANVMPAGSNGNFGKIVQFQKSFVYKGGPLCITIRHTGLSGALGSPEALFGTLATNRTVFSPSVGAVNGSFYFANYTGTAMKLGYIPSVMTPNSLATAEGNSAWNLPFVSNYSVQTIIPASQLKTVTVGSAITGFSLRADGNNATGIPTADTNLTQFDVSIAPATHGPLSISTTYANNIGAGEVIVRSGPMTVPANAYPALGTPRENAWYVPFTRAYVYTGGDLCVTFRGQGSLTAGSNLFLDGQSNVPLATGSSIYNYGTSAATTGSTWGPIAMRLAFTQRAYCPCDLNNDGVVEDGDFSIFVNAYNILDCAEGSMPFGCPADFNYDGLVDDADFQIFVVAYNNLLCP